MAGTQWDAVAALVDPVRRALYDHVRRQRQPVTREQAAAAVTISRTLTAFHLDKLVETGLLRARYEAPVGKRRGRGRAPKVYETTDADLNLTVPPRHYELMGEILADAMAERPNDAVTAAHERAFDRGRDVGVTQSAGVRAAAHADPPGQTRAQLAAARRALTGLGFEPRADELGAEQAGLLLDNCPFHQLATRQTELICGINHALIVGILAGVGADRLQARLEPLPGSCCVHVSCVRPTG